MPQLRDVAGARKQRKAPGSARLSRLHKPEDMTLEAWQIELRRQFGRAQDFRLKNVGEHPVFSTFAVTNPQSGNTYQVQVRGIQPGDNACTCPDFATNTLGTCKHIEFTLAMLEQKRGGVAALRAGYQPPYSEVALHYGALREVRFRPGADCPIAVARLAARYFGADGCLKPEACARFEEFVSATADSEHEVRCADDVLAYVAEVRDAAARRERVAKEFPRGIRSAGFKNLLKANLYDYQREGALFAARAGRCLIGDEMGLGKTLQAIAAAEIMAKLYGVERVLIICPTSLKHQWQSEISRFTDRATQVIGGLRPRRQLDYAAPSFYKIASYDTVHRDLDLISSWGPELVILDEAQRIKNWATRAARSVKKLEAPYAVVLTGTPLENRLEELISIVQFVDRFRLGPTFRLLDQHQVRDEVGKVTGYRDLNEIGRSLEPILIRRQKDAVLEQLPKRIDNHVYLPMAPLQRKLHEEAREIVARIVHKWRRYRFLSEADKRRLMIALQNMRMACDSSYLLDGKTDDGKKPDEATTILDELFERPGTKAVVFSQWIRMHELLIRRFKGRGWGHVHFHGGVPSSQRKNLIEQFREDPRCRVFLSSDAGGVGLNLQHASVVLNLDLPWNPAVLEQRIGRVHRLGQKQPVRVVNFVAQGTIEEGMLGVLKFKKSLFAGVLDGGEKDVFLGGSRLTKFMESIETATKSIPTASPIDEPAEAQESGSRRSVASDESAESAPSETTSAGDPWSSLLQAGMAWLQQATAPQNNGTTTRPTALVTRDERTGESFVKLPLPPAEVLGQVMTALGRLVEGLSKK